MLIAFLSCENQENRYSTTKEMLVGSKKAYSNVGTGSPHIFDTILVVKYEDNGKQIGWTGLVKDLDGFDYEPGYEYRIKVRIDHVVSGKSNTNSYHFKYYKFLKLLSKEQKESVGITDVPN